MPSSPPVSRRAIRPCAASSLIQRREQAEAAGNSDASAEPIEVDPALRPVEIPDHRKPRSEPMAPTLQNQALNAILFLYREVLSQKIDYVNGVVRAKRPRRLPVVLTREEVKRILAHITGREWITAMLLYGTGLRLMECLRLRVKDIDFSRNELVVRSGKGDKDRVTMLPATVKEPLRKHVESVRRQYTSPFLCHALA